MMAVFKKIASTFSHVIIAILSAILDVIKNISVFLVLLILASIVCFPIALLIGTTIINFVLYLISLFG